MNCQRFNDQLQEYVEGSLASETQATAEQHLAGCRRCREMVSRELRTAQLLSGELHKAVSSLTLSSEVPGRVLAALGCGCAGERSEKAGFSLWNQLRWRLAATACALVGILALWLLLSTQARKDEKALSPGLLPHPVISVQAPYTVPVYTFRREGNFVVDALTYQSHTVRQTLLAQANSLSVKKPKERKSL